MINKETALSLLNNMQKMMLNQLKLNGIGDMGTSLLMQQFDMLKEYIEGSVVDMPLSDKIKEIIEGNFR